MDIKNNMFLLRIDKFNTDHFGLKMGQISLLNENDDLDKEICVKCMKDIMKQAKSNGYKHITIKINTSKKNVIKGIQSQSMEISDTLVRYIFSFGKSILPAMDHKCTLEDCTVEDLPYLKDIARESFKIDRFHSDDNLPDELCDLYYDKWIENSYNGLADKVVVAHYNGDVVGFTTGKLWPEEDFSQLVLSAVSDKYRGIGLYTSMIHKGVEWLLGESSLNTKGVILGTQIDNIPVQKAWIKLGFTIFDSHYVFQKYLD